MKYKVIGAAFKPNGKHAPFRRSFEAQTEKTAIAKAKRWLKGKGLKPGTIRVLTWGDKPEEDVRDLLTLPRTDAPFGKTFGQSDLIRKHNIDGEVFIKLNDLLNILRRPR